MKRLITIRRGWDSFLVKQSKPNMRICSSVLVLVVLILLGTNWVCLAAPEEDGVALAIIYDTSGSMSETVRDSKGTQSPKYVIANRALLSIVRQIQTFSTNSASAPKIQAALYTFNGLNAKEVIKLGPFDPSPFESFGKSFSTPDGGTPLGNSLRTAADAVLSSPLPRKHVLVITDGMNTQGPEPSMVLPGINQRAEQKQSPVFVHFIAFDVDATVFNPVKKLGASVAAASDEVQLNTQLDFILQNQILLEKPKTK